MYERIREPVAVEPAVRPRRSTSVVQARLRVGATTDPAEREADRVADEVTALLGRTSRTIVGDGRRPTRIARSTGGAVTVSPAGAGAAELTDLEVPAAQRGRGLGQRLVEQAVERATDLGATRVRLTSDDDGSGRLDAWYERLGFRSVGADGAGRVRFEAPTARVVRRAAAPTVIRRMKRTLGGGKESPAKKRKGLTQDAVKGGLKTAMGATAPSGQPLWENATTFDASGKWTEEVVVRGEQSFSGERTRQVLRHLSTSIFAYVQKAGVDEKEVQSMFVNKRVFVSTNLPKSVETLLAASASDLKKMLMSKTNAAALGIRGDRSQRKLAALLAGERGDIPFDDPAEKENVQAIAAALNHLAADPSTYLVPCSSIDEAKNRIEGAAWENKILVVSPDGAAHAEQNLILAYVQSGSKARAYVYGKKRPCTGCYLTFTYAKEVLGCAGLTFNGRPGGYWESPPYRLLTKVMNEGVDVADIHTFADTYLPKLAHRTAVGKVKGDKRKDRHDVKAEDTGFDSGSESEG